MRRYSSWWLPVALGTMASAAHAGPATTLINNVFFVTSTATNGLCVPGTTTNNVACPSVPASQTLPLTNGMIPIDPVAELFDSDYELDITVTDKSSIAGSFYDIVLIGQNFDQDLGTTPVVTVDGSTKSFGSFSVGLNDGLAPGSYSLDITNVYFKNGSPLFTASLLTVTVTETVTNTAAPEPASLAIFGAGLGMMGLLRRGCANR
jgi:hypothetical protein